MQTPICSPIEADKGGVRWRASLGWGGGVWGLLGLWEGDLWGFGDREGDGGSFGVVGV